MLTYKTKTKATKTTEIKCEGLKTKVLLKGLWFDVEFNIEGDNIHVVAVTSLGDEVLTTAHENDLIKEYIKDNYNISISFFNV